MKISIAARQISSYEENGVLIVAFGGAEGNAEAGDYLILQRTLEPSADDVRLGMDAVYIEVFDQSRGEYGAPSHAELRSNSLRLVINEDASRQIGASEIEVHFPAHEHERLSSALARVLHGVELRCVAV
jgi:hypothetical protein